MTKEQAVRLACQLVRDVYRDDIEVIADVSNDEASYIDNGTTPERIISYVATIQDYCTKLLNEML